MGYSADPFKVPGLNMVLKAQDLEKSCNLYNELPTDSEQPEILESHISKIAEIFIRHHVEKLLGINNNDPHCRWARPIANSTVDLSNVHGHIFVLTNHMFHPYEFQTGPSPDLSGVGNDFLPEFAEYLSKNKLSGHIGLQVIDTNSPSMLELVLPQATFMLDISALKDCVPTKQTGWKFEEENGNPRVCKGNEIHGTYKDKHIIYNEGVAHSKPETCQDIINDFVKSGILVV